MDKAALFSPKFLSPRVMTRALMLMDKSTAIVVGAAWAVAVVTLIIAFIAMHSAAAARHEALDSAGAEPVLPAMNATPLNQREAQGILDRLQRQYPDLKFDVSGTQELTVKSADGNKFHEWITALAYVDAMAPQFRWTLESFCVGHCGSDLMTATVTGQRVQFAMPSP